MSNFNFWSAPNGCQWKTFVIGKLSHRSVSMWEPAAHELIYLTRFWLLLLFTAFYMGHSLSQEGNSFLISDQQSLWRQVACFWFCFRDAWMCQNNYNQSRTMTQLLSDWVLLARWSWLLFLLKDRWWRQKNAFVTLPDALQSSGTHYKRSIIRCLNKGGMGITIFFFCLVMGNLSD